MQSVAFWKKITTLAERPNVPVGGLVAVIVGTFAWYFSRISGWLILLKQRSKNW